MQVLHAVDVPVTDLRLTTGNPPSVELLYSQVDAQEMWLDVHEARLTWICCVVTRYG